MRSNNNLPLFCLLTLPNVNVLENFSKGDWAIINTYQEINRTNLQEDRNGKQAMALTTRLLHLGAISADC